MLTIYYFHRVPLILNNNDPLFTLSFYRHLSYLHNVGALGPFAGARPAQHEHNLRLHHQRHQRHPGQQARQPLRHSTEQTADHAPGTSGQQLRTRTGGAGLWWLRRGWREGRDNEAELIYGADRRVRVGRRRQRSHMTPLPLLTPVTNGDLSEVWRIVATPIQACCDFFFLFFTQRPGDAPPLPPSSISTSTANRATRGRRRMLSGTWCSHLPGGQLTDTRPGARSGSLHVYAASPLPFIPHHSCFPKNGSTPRGPH